MVLQVEQNKFDLDLSQRE